MKLIKSTLVLVLIFTVAVLRGQENQKILVKGTVTDGEGNALAGATVLLTGQNRGSQTNFEGYFQLSSSKAYVDLEVRYVGYTTFKKSLELKSDEEISIVLERDEFKLNEVIVSAIRVQADAPITHSSMNKAEIAERNLGQDIPIIMNYMPSVVTTSDAGAGVGYTGIRVRGSDATRVNITINGIPYNDSESMGTFWVNLPDFASSVESLQLQRGVGTSTNGAGAFGASLNMLTESFSEDAYADLAFSAGSFNTFKETVQFSTGRIRNGFELQGRLSKISSDGYIDRASSDLGSYFLQGSFNYSNGLIKVLAFGGKEKTYQAWYGVDQATLDSDRRFNPAGMYTDEAGNTQFYENQTDNYWQDHFQVHWNQSWSDYLSSNFALHYTYGRGYYENYQDDAYYPDFGLESPTVDGMLMEYADLIDQRWLDNDFYGFTGSLNYQKDGISAILGGAYNQYKGDHFGRVIWAQYSGSVRPYDSYYDNYGDKNDGNIFIKLNYDLNDRIMAYLDLQERWVDYRASGVSEGTIDVNYAFFNPKLGLTYSLSDDQNLYASYAVAHREPNRTDFENGSPKPEKLQDLEFGYRLQSKNFKLNTNLYYMYYTDQLVLTGALDDVGNPIRTNVGESYRLGMELDMTLQLGSQFYIMPNITYSQNKNLDFVFQRDGELQDLGKTDIAFSPNLVFGNRISFLPVPNAEISFLSKYVSEQYMANIDAENSKLDAYLTHDLLMSYTLRSQGVFKEIGFNIMLNNIFNTAYVSNGYYYTYDDTWTTPGEVVTLDGAGYYPQAQFNFLAGINLSF